VVDDVLAEDLDRGLGALQLPRSTATAPGVRDVVSSTQPKPTSGFDTRDDNVEYGACGVV
jgi:hypothetical protein